MFLIIKNHKINVYVNFELKKIPNQGKLKQFIKFALFEITVRK